MTVKAMDAAGNIGTGTFTITVRDTTAPVISRLSASPDSIWPPNHKMVPVTLTALVMDKVDPAPVTRIVQVTSEDTDDDHEKSKDKSNGAWEITGPLTLKLRAEDHVAYLITVESCDSSGNVSARSIRIEVAKEHDGRDDHDDHGRRRQYR